MSLTSKINISSGIKYLSDKRLNFTLPVNSIFDKGKVGCGGTTLAIESDKPYIICVPFISLIENKLAQYPNNRYAGKLYGFYSQNSLKRDLIAYLDRVDIPKIIVTYDSLEKLTNWINPKDYNLLVDELHLLFTEYSYRQKAIDSVLNNYYKYNEYCFMTATPLEKEFTLSQLIHLPIVEVIWENATNVNVQSVKVTGTVKRAIANLINEFLTGKVEGNAYFFVNSVKYIKDLVAECKLTNHNTRAIYSSNNLTRTGLIRSNTTSKPKKINFVTSTAFEGSDLYDENGLTFIVSDSSETQTLIDISTKFQQIAGRIRNSKYADTIYHIYKNTRYSELTYDEFKEYTNTIKNETQLFIDNNKGAPYIKRLKDDESIFNVFYMNKKDDELEFNENKLKMDLYNFKICRNIYSLRVNLDREYAKYNFTVENFDYLAEGIVKSSNINTFKESVLEIKKTKNYNHPAFTQYDFLQEAIDILGYDEIEKSNYIISKIKDKLVRNEDIGLEAKILKSLNIRFNPIIGDFYSNVDIKEKFIKVYDTLDLNVAAKATDILKYYDVKEVQRRIDGKNTRGYIIMGKKITIK